MLKRPMMDIPWLGALLHMLLVQEHTFSLPLISHPSPTFTGEQLLPMTVNYKLFLYNIVNLKLHKHLNLVSRILFPD